MRCFMLIALSKIGVLEKQAKLTIVKNMLRFTKYPEATVNQMGDKLREAVREAAVLACDSHPTMGKAEFTVLCMKFGSNKVVADAEHFLEKKVSKMIDFDQQRGSLAERRSVFTELILHMESEADIIREQKLELL